MHIRKIKAILLVSVLVLSSCIINKDYLYTFMSRNDDSFEKQVLPSSATGDFNFVTITDMHFGRDKSYHPDLSKTQALIGSLEPELIFNLGDFADHGTEKEYLEVSRFNQSLYENGIIPDTTRIFMLLGNHDIKQPIEKPWNMYFNQPYYHTIEYNGISFYLMNNSTRTLGRKQLDELGKALSEDSNTRKILMCHIPIHSIDALGYFNMADSKEVNKLLTMCHDNDVDMIISGHCHRDSEFHYNNNLVERVCASYNGKDSPFETPPYLYNMIYSEAENALTVEAYVYDPGTEEWGLSTKQKYRMI